ncbi:sigma-70 family RNA polymerase sigma factor [Stieleria sp. TO1_6]|uniref:RNA polymerase sigma factor n=1 Tax=Stieleria tagensis TaxID=2956795 RepID=UPI00209AC1BB|nr:sigma-70 family RNA polymerase sigma factor [Stieleria tagensis]MCO8123770.1 sigma-70 family RNA polymerase sigma factor [Stieleria tagensis]
MRHPQITELFDRHANALVLFARNWCQSPEDAVQAAFVDLSQLPTSPRNPLAWLYRTTKCKALNVARAEMRRGHHRQIAASLAPQWFESQGDDPATQNAELQLALEKLTAQEREIVVARVWGEMGFEELAEVFDCGVATAFRRYKAALTKLKQLLEQDERRI